MKNTVIKYGVISGLILSVLMLIGMSMHSAEVLDYGSSMAFGYISMIIALSFIFFAIRSYRQKINKGSITFGKAFSIGLLISLIAAAFYTTTWMIYSETSGGEQLIEMMKRQYAEDIENSAANEAEAMEKLNQMNKDWEMYDQPFIKIMITLTEILPVALLVSLIAALVLKRKPSE